MFLDEVSEMTPALQAKLLQVLQDGEFARLGGKHDVHVDVRIVAATNRDLEAQVEAGRFRADLFHRLNVYRLRVPPLRERLEDVPLLAGWFSDQSGRRIGCGSVRLSADARAALQGLSWPGNVRELENVISRAVLRASADAARGEPVIVEVRHLGAEFGAPAAEPRPPPSPVADSDTRTLREATDEFQRERIRAALRRDDGNWAAAARALGMDRGNLHHLAKRLGLR
jgi:anaerobic nitric oxide reductase transcription regulator